MCGGLRLQELLFHLQLKPQDHESGAAKEREMKVLKNFLKLQPFGNVN